ncbi:MAG: carbon starvation protein A [Oscillospiraceae bacterium]|nr:carbon starvation protein A [Oscillospiraceae bacterium]
MNIIVIVCAIAALLLGYLFYGRYLAKKWGIDPARETPSQDCFDGKDYVPTPPVVVLGHHFASVAGAGTIIGTVRAAAFGWLPALLWIVLGSVFIGAAHDFGALFASLRHRGRSLGRVLREHVGEKAQRVFTVFALLVLVLLVACFTNVLADSFASDGALLSLGAGNVSPRAGAGTASILFVLVGLLFGLLVFRKNLPMVPMTVLCLALMAASVWAGLNVGLNLPYWVWVAVIAVYLVAAALAPVWALLQPRDFLCAFLLWGMMLFSLVVLLIPALGGKAAGLPAVNESAFSGGALFSMLSVIVFGGAVSGYNALIASGTTAKQLANEKHARPVAVGSVLLNALLALIVLLALSGQVAPDASASPFDSFADRVSEAAGSPLVYYLMLMTAATFALTTLDTCTRLARYLFAELFNPDNRRLKKLEGAQRFFATPAVGTVILVLLGCGLGLVRDLDRLWGLFGAANLLLAGLALLIAAIWLRGEGKKTGMLVVPMCLLLVVSPVYLVWNALRTLRSFAGWVDGLSLGLSAVLLVLAAVLLAQALPALFHKPEEAADDAD